MTEVKKEITEEKTILLSLCDHSGSLSVTGTLDIFMDIASLHEDYLGFDAITMEKMGLFWIIGKNRIHYINRPKMLDRILVRSWPLKPSRLYGNREYLIESMDGEPLVFGETEWLIANRGLEKIVPIRDYYPREEELLDRKLFEDRMRKVSKDFAPGQRIGTYVVRPTDIDFVGHMNNAAYSRAIMSFIPTSVLDAHPVKDVEIFYGLQCKEGDELSVCRREIENGAEYGAFLPDGRNVMTARFSFEK